MIYLRELKTSDAQLMLEWMHDFDIQKRFRRDMMSVSIDDVISFCEKYKIPDVIKNGDDLHFAIAGENDEYLGTISLKNIDLKNSIAEYAISTRKKAWGKGVALTATGLILKKAFTDYGLHRVYLNVLADNDAAIRLYEKCGFKNEGNFREHLQVNGEYVDLKWYGILDSEYDEKIYTK